MGSLERDFERAVGKVKETIIGKVAGSALDKAVERAICSMDDEAMERLIVYSTWFIYQFGPGHSLKTKKSRAAVFRWIDSWRRDNYIYQSIYAPGILDGYTYDRPKGIENIPDGGVVYCTNHPTGSAYGNWYSFVLNYNVASEKGEEHQPRWFHREWSNDPLVEKTSLNMIYSRAARMMSRASGNLMFTRDQSSIMEVIAQGQEVLTRGGSLGLNVQGKESAELDRLHRSMGRLAMAVTGPGDFPICPVGTWHEGGDLNISFGEPFYLKDLLGGRVSAVFDKRANQAAADKIGTEIARLLPERRRGYYGPLTGR